MDQMEAQEGHKWSISAGGALHPLQLGNYYFLYFQQLNDILFNIIHYEIVLRKLK